MYPSNEQHKLSLIILKPDQQSYTPIIYTNHKHGEWFKAHGLSLRLQGPTFPPSVLKMNGPNSN